MLLPATYNSDVFSFKIFLIHAGVLEEKIFKGGTHLGNISSALDPNLTHFAKMN